MGYLLTIETITDLVTQLKTQGEKVVLTHGTFDLFHVGHKTMLKASKKQGDILIVGIEPDSNVEQFKRYPIMNELQRANLASGCEYVDFVFINKSVEELRSDYYSHLYKTLDPNVVTYGRDFKFKSQFDRFRRDVPKTKYIEIKTMFNKKQDSPSTTKIINRIVERYK